MYIEKWAFWAMIIAIIYLVIKNYSDYRKTRQVASDLVNAYNNMTKYLIGRLWETEKTTKGAQKDQFERIVGAVENAIDNSVYPMHSLMDNTDLLACCEIFKSFEMRKKFTKVEVQDNAPLCSDEPIDTLIRNDLGKWLNYNNYGKEEQ